ncbi:MAG TPA: hypothetical protein VMC85_13230 [Desulfomonilaceae bacterium]|nr:hypothetical protein [Desulfomonilaceae bacterium]
MKGLVAVVAVTVALLGAGGAAYGQYDYGSMYPGAAQSYGYGNYGQGYGQASPGYGQYSQTMPDYSQYAQGQGAYGQGYGQQNSPYQQGQGGYGNYPGYGANQSYGSYGYPREYNAYQGYGAAESTPYGSYQQQPSTRRTSRQPTQYQPVRPQQQRATVTERSIPQTPSRASTEPSSRESSSIYWDGRETVPENSQGVAVQSPSQSIQPQPQPNVRQQVRSIPGAASVQTPRRTNRNVLKRQSASTPAPPPRKNVQWGKRDASTSDQTSTWAEEEKPDSKRGTSMTKDSPPRAQGIMKWGKQDRPSMIGAEPGSTQGSETLGDNEAAARESVETKSSARKFEWGRTTR